MVTALIRSSGFSHTLRDKKYRHRQAVFLFVEAKGEAKPLQHFVCPCRLGHRFRVAGKAVFTGLRLPALPPSSAPPSRRCHSANPRPAGGHTRRLLRRLALPTTGRVIRGQRRCTPGCHPPGPVVGWVSSLNPTLPSDGNTAIDHQA
jgi:hypothetical protein